MDVAISLRTALIAALASAPAASAADFNRDGYADLAVLSSHVDVAGGTGATGGVHVFYGGPQGIGALGAALVSAIPGVDTLSHGCLATGDFDGDGFDDLAVGCPRATVSDIAEAGLVVVYEGSAMGLDLAAPRRLHQDVSGVKDKAEGDADGGEQFGSALAAGDFDGDGRDDLAVGVQETVSGEDGTGAVHVFYGAKKGLSVDGDALWHQNRSGVKGKCREGDAFGAALATGDFDGDGRADLAIGIPEEEAAALDPAGPRGAAAVLMGSKKGLTAHGDLLIRRADLGFVTGAQVNVRFGEAVAAGDFDGDLRDELVIGAPLDLLGAGAFAGAIYLVPSGADGVLPTSAVTFQWHQLGAATPASTGARFGSVLRAGDWTGDGTADLAVGAPGLTVDGHFAAGGMAILYGGDDGLGSNGAQPLTESVSGVPGAAEDFDVFGSALGSGDFDRDGADDLAIGVAGEHFFGSATQTGSVQLLRGSPSGIVTSGSKVLMQGVDDMPGLPGAGAGFGAALGS